MIVVGVDGSSASLDALCWATREANGRGWHIRVIRCWPEPALVGPWLVDAFEGEEQERTKLTALVAEVADANPGIDVAGSVIIAAPVPALLEAANAAQMVVVGARGLGGFKGLLLGSVSDRIVRRSPCPVVVVRGASHGPVREVVVGVDGSDPGRAALAWAAEHARVHQLPLAAVMAWSYPAPESDWGSIELRPDYDEADARATLDAILADVLGPDPGVEIEPSVVCDLTATTVLQRAEGATLVVVGRRRGGPSTRYDLGSVSQQVLHHAPGPVAIVPEPATHD